MKSRLFLMGLLSALLLFLSSAGFGEALSPFQALEGRSEADNLGVSVANAGDVNGDGYDDIIVGGFRYQHPKPKAGPVYIYFGGQKADNLPDVSLRDKGEGGLFGWSVAGAGDLNGDGYDDVIVGVRRSYARGESGGRVYIYYGGLNMDDAPALTLTTGETFDGFGESIAGVSDLNGDGFADVAIGAYRGKKRGDPGKAYIYFGGKDMDNLPDLVLSAKSRFDWFGKSLAGAGDVNGDGLADIIIGAPCHRVDRRVVGQGYIYFGSPQMDDLPDVILKSNSLRERLGWSVAGAGDLNGDGYDDVIVGTMKGRRRRREGLVQVYFGGPQMDSRSDVTLNGQGAITWFTNSIAGVGDVNGDGSADVLVGSYCNPKVTQSPGLAYLYFGGSQMASLPDVILTKKEVSGWFGWVVAGGGDINGDGKADVVIGALKVGRGGIRQTYVYTTKGLSSQNGASTSPLPSTFDLGQNYPNPFNPRTTIPFQIPGVGGQMSVPTTLKIYNANGQVVRILVDGEKGPGSYLVIWDGRNDFGEEVSSGIYFYRLAAGDFIDSKKMALLR